ncbi:MAG: tyrosine recombinase XerC [Clostridia bacterium]|nr:tyrosine recombinase XerC [Clostridia bacterium]
MKQEIFEESPEILIKFLSYLQTVKNKSVGTVYNYFCDLRIFFRYLKVKKYKLGTIESFDEISILDINEDILKNINLTDIYEYMNYLLESRQNQSRARSRKVSSLRTFFKFVTYNLNILEHNPVEHLEVAKKSKTLPKFLSLEQSQKLLETISNSGSKFKERDYCIVLFFLNCGMRLSELVNINLRDINDDNILKLKGKGNKERIIYLNNSCVSALNRYLEIRPKSGLTDKNALFISRQNNRMSPQTVQLLVNKYLQKSGLFGLSVHKLRHTAATLMYQHGKVDIRILKDILGHESLSTTEIYTHTANEQIQKALESNPLSNQ